MMKVPEFQAAMERTGVERKCYTTDEVATMLGISMKSVYQLLTSCWPCSRSSDLCFLPAM